MIMLIMMIMTMTMVMMMTISIVMTKAGVPSTDRVTRCYTRAAPLPLFKGSHSWESQYWRRQWDRKGWWRSRTSCASTLFISTTGLCSILCLCAGKVGMNYGFTAIIKKVKHTLSEEVRFQGSPTIDFALIFCLCAGQVGMMRDVT